MIFGTEYVQHEEIEQDSVLGARKKAGIMECFIAKFWFLEVLYVLNEVTIFTGSQYYSFCISFQRCSHGHTHNIHNIIYTHAFLVTLFINGNIHSIYIQYAVHREYV